MRKLLTTLLAASVSWLALTAPASADPTLIGSFILVNLLPGLIGTGIGPTLVGSIALGLGAVGLQIGLTLANMPRIKPQDYKSTFSTGESSEIRAIGRVRVGGLKAFGNTKDYNRYRLACRVKGPIDAVETQYLGGREVTVETNGDVSSPPWSFYAVSGGGEFEPGEIGSFVNIQSKVGDGTETAWPALTTDFPTQWTTNHRVRGIAQSLITYRSPGIADNPEKFQQLYQSLPDSEQVIRAEKVYDPRDVAQDADDPATWVWTDNGILCAAHILRSYPNFASDDFDWTGIAAQADLADEEVDTLTGTEPRSRCWGLWPSEKPRGEVMLQVLDSIGAEIVAGEDGKILVRLIDDGPTAEIEFAERHIVKMDRRYGPEAVERHNLATVKYYSPERNFEMAEVPLHKTDGSGGYLYADWSRIDDEIARYGEKKYELELPFCPSGSQAQRILRRKFAVMRADRGVAKVQQVGMAAWGLSYASFQVSDIADEGFVTNEVYAIDAPRDDPTEPTVEIPFAVWPSLPSWNPATDEAPAPEDIPDLTQPSDVTKPNQPVSACIVEYPDKTREIRVHSVTPAGATYVEAVFRLYSGNVPQLNQSMTEVEATGTFDTAYRQIKYNIFTNPDTWGAGWSLGAGWAAAPPYLVATTGAQSAANQTHTFASGMSYDYVVTVSNRTAGVVRPRFGGGGAVEGTDISANGTFTQTLVAGAASTTANFRKDATFNGKLSAPKLYHTGDFPVVELGVKVDFRKRIFDAEGNGSDFSDALVVNAIAINNTAPTAPTVAVEAVVIGPDTLLRYTITPTSLTAVRATVEFTDDNGSTWTPGFASHAHIGLGANGFTTTELAASGKGFRVTLYSSNGTAGATGQAIYT